MLGALIAAAWFVQSCVASGGADATSLVQARLEQQPVMTMADLQALQAPGPGAAAGESQTPFGASAEFVPPPAQQDEDMEATENSTDPPPEGVQKGAFVFRLAIGKSYGATYTCLTSIEFFGGEGTPVPAEYVSQSSCYGCATTCSDCDAAYGNPRAQFITGNKDYTSPDAWSCSAQGSFNDGVGLEDVTFTLPERPLHGLLKLEKVGDFSPKAFSLLEYDWEKGKWSYIGVVHDAPQAQQVMIDVRRHSLDFAPVYPTNYLECGGANLGSPTNLERNTDTRLEPAYIPQGNRVLVKTDHGVQVDGNFGTLTLRGVEYDLVQVAFQYPSFHRMNDGELAVGEMLLVHTPRPASINGSSVGAKLVVVSMLLQLGPIGDDYPDHIIFENIGLDNLPTENEPKAVPLPLDLGGFIGRIRGDLVELPCSDSVAVFVPVEPAYVTGIMVEQARNAQIDLYSYCPNVDMWGRPLVQPGTTDPGGTFLTNESAGVVANGSNESSSSKYIPQTQTLTQSAMARAYVVADWAPLNESPS